MRTTSLALLSLLALACNQDGGTPRDPDAACMDHCARLEACGSPEAADCAADCSTNIGTYNYPGPGCLELYTTYLDCRTAASCDDLLNNPYEVCNAENEALYSEPCASDTCLAHADHVIECGVLAPEGRLSHALECSFAVAEAFEYGQACQDASDALYRCVVDSSCEDLNDGANCMDKEDEQKMICGL